MIIQENILLKKIESFTRKHYKNQLIKGGILFLSLGIIAFFSISFAEYYGRFSTTSRTVIFYTFITICIGVFVWYVVKPLLGLYNIKRQYDVNKASVLIGQFFPEVKDKLTNTLQLQDSVSEKTSSLLLASIEQRINELSPVPFSSAISFSSNKKYFKYAMLPALGLLLVLLISPGFKSSGNRIVNFDKHFKLEAPFNFITDLRTKQAVQNQDFLISLTLDGTKIPNEASINIGKGRFKMKKTGINEFQFNIKNIQKSDIVFFEAGGFKSIAYKINLGLKPSILGYKAYLTYPSYLNIPSETSSNLGEISVPQGTIIKWDFALRNVEQLSVNKTRKLDVSRNTSSLKNTFLKSSEIIINTTNSQVSTGDSMSFRINVIPDQYPEISVDKKNDSLSNLILYFLGQIKDDYGFHKLTFHYKFDRTATANNKDKSGVNVIKIENKSSSQKFYHYWNLKALNIAPEDKLSYYFTVWDNDGINGPKQTQSQTFTFTAPSIKVIKEKTELANQEIKNSMTGAQSNSEQLEKEIESIEKMLTEKKRLDWNEKKKIQDILNKQKQIQEEIRKTIEKNLEKNLKEEEFKKVDDAILEKQKQLEKLMEDILDEETRALMEKIQKLLEQDNTEQLQKEMEKFKFNEEEMSKKMDRMLELFKELELEKKLNETIDKIEELAKDQKQLAEDAKNEEKTSDDLEAEQEKLNQEFEDIKKDLQDIQEKNQDLESPKDIDERKDQQENIDQKQQEGKESAGKGKKKSASEQMNEASEELKKMAEDMWQEMQEEYAEEQIEDYNTLRQILENLVTLSFEQEEVINGFKQNKTYNSNYIVLRQKQRKIKDETQLVEDSLLALSKRNPQIQHFVNSEISQINEHIDKSLEYLGERYTNNAIVHQQFAMTGYNNLALMLSDVLDQMQQQMKANEENKGKPKSQCKKPGSKPGSKPGKPNASAIKKMQQQLAKQLEEMQKGMKEGGKQPSSKQFAQMAAQQAAIRKKLQDLQRQLQQEGKGGSLGDIKQTQDLMDDIEKDLYFKKLNPETFKKLKQLEIKLNQHEEAEKEQEQDQKRVGKEGSININPIPPDIQKYLNESKKETELFKTISPELLPYFEQKVKQYFGQ